MSKSDQLATTYVPSEAEPQIAALWKSSGVFAAPSEADSDTSFSIVIPPPNVTAALHLGHALNNSLQDVVVRYNRMLGNPTLWMPGTDHAGIATQTVVEKRLLAEGIKRLEMGREAFVERTQAWKEEYEQVIVDQLLAMGASCDWDRIRFTMDEMCSVAVRHAFYTLFKDGLIYRGKRLVNWDPATQTALADDEVEMEEVAGHMWYLKYPLENPLDDGTTHVTVATTRPETMFGDTAVAINPQDPRAEKLRGQNVVLPIVDRLIPIIEDDYVVLPDPESSDNKAKMASGFLKVTPAHDQNDWEIGERHGLDVVNVLAADGTVSDAYGWAEIRNDVTDIARQFLGMDREVARQAVADWFEAQGLLEQVKPYSHSVGHSYRSHVPIEPWLSDQWYVAVTDDRLSGSANRALKADQQSDPAPEHKTTDASGDGDLAFTPQRYAKTFQTWHENIRDWCISRQLWWGHQIPVWSKATDITHESAQVTEAPVVKEDGTVHVSAVVGDQLVQSVCIPPQETLDADLGGGSESDLIKQLEADGFVRDPDVLDTWFSSALWPMSTMGWPHPENYPETVGLLESYNPTSVLMTAREIITLWVSRMTMFNRYFRADDGAPVPFTDVFIHAMVQDGHGQKMSKSLGNGVDPRDIIHSHGADAMRYALVAMTTETQDVRMPVDVICPHTGESFDPEYVTTSAGYEVAAPVQKSPSDPSKEMVTLYGVASGEVEATDERPLARNSSPKFDAGRAFVNKVWNATRFSMTRIDGSGEPVSVAESDLVFVDKWILSRLSLTLDELAKAYEGFQFARIAELTYDFIWRDLADVYLEAIKPTVDDSKAQQAVLASVINAVMRMLHPICPFVTEELWLHVRDIQCGTVAGLELVDNEILAGAAWPKVTTDFGGGELVKTFEQAFGLVQQVRNVRAQRGVKPKDKVDLFVSGGPQSASYIEGSAGMVQTLAGVAEVSSADDVGPSASAFVYEGVEFFVATNAADIDPEAEAKRLQESLEALESKIANLEKRLANENYVNKAKPELVQETRDQLASAIKERDVVAASLQ